MEFKIQTYELAFPQALDTAQVHLLKRRGWRLYLVDKAKVLALSEIAPWKGFGAEPEGVAQEIEKLKNDQQAQAQLVQFIADLIADQAFTKSLKKQDILEERVELLSRRLRPFFERVSSPELCFGFELLALDALARQLGLPLSMLFEPKTTLSAQTHHLAINGKQALKCARQGYKAIKMKVGVKDHWVEELMEIARIRAVLPHIEIRVDANQAWTADLAFGFCIAAQAYGVSWIEEPCSSPSEQERLFEKLQGLKSIAIGIDESLSHARNEAELSLLLNDSRVKVVTLKPMFIGGFLKTIQLALRCVQLGKRVCITHALGSWIERTATAHAAAALQATQVQILAGLGGELLDDLKPALRVYGGAIRIPFEEGIGQVEPRDFTHTEALQTEALSLVDDLEKTVQNSVQEALKPQYALPNPLKMAVLARPHHYAVRQGNEQMSYRCLAEQSLCLLDRLKCVLNHSKSVPLVSFAGSLSIDWLIVCHAVSAFGGILAPLKPNLPAEEHKRTLALIQPDYHINLIDESKGSRLEVFRVNSSRSFDSLLWSDSVRSTQSKQIWSDELLFKKLHQLPDWSWEADRFVICTSGTSGEAQAVSLSTAQVSLNAFGSAIRLGLLPEDTWLACLPPYHVGGLSILLRCLFYQTTVQLTEPKAEAIALALPNCQLISLTPSLLSELCTWLEGVDEQQRLTITLNLRVVLVGGAATSESLWQRAIHLGLALRLTWGMTEAASQLCTQVESKPPNTPLPPLPFAMIDAKKQRLSVSGPLVKTSPLYTNDLGRVSLQGVQVLGRADDVIISGGINILPQEIEAVLLAHPRIREVAVIAVPDLHYGACPVAFLVAESSLKPKENQLDLEPDQLNSLPNQDELKAWCRSQMSSYKTPKWFIWKSSLPRTELGKIQRQSLRAEFDALVEFNK